MATDVNLILRYLKADKERQAGLYSQEPACPNDQRQGEFTPPTLDCPFWLGGVGAAGTGWRNDSIIPSRGGNPWATQETSPSYVDREIKAATLRIDSKIGEFDFVSITDYQDSDKFYTEGGDASPVDGVVFFQGSNLQQFSEELRLSRGFGNNQLVGGLYFMDVDGDYTGQFATPFYDASATLPGDNFYIPLFTGSQKTTSFAVFLQNEWRATEKLSLIAGLRYWRDEREGAYYADEPSQEIHVAFDKTQVVGTVHGQPFDESVVPITLTPSDATPTFDDVTARLEIDYHVNDDLLVFASYNRGSKSGGFSFSTGPPFEDGTFGYPIGTSAQFVNGIPFDPEVLNSFEVGMKSTIGGTTTFDASAFYYDYEDYQAFVQLGFNQTIINLPATAYGLEAEINSHPLDGLTLQLGVSVLSSNVKDIILPDYVTEVEHDMPQAPSFSGNALARYEFGFGGGLAFVQGDAQFTDDFCFTALCAPVEKEKGYTLLNARIGYGAEDGRWEVALWGDNLTDEEYRVYAFDSSLFAGVVAGVYGKPQTYGLSATWRFGAAYH